MLGLMPPRHIPTLLLCGHSALKAVSRDLKQSRPSDALPATVAFNSLSFPNLVTIETSGGVTS